MGTGTGRGESVVVCTYAVGAPLYFSAMRETVRSALRHTSFDVLAMVGTDCAIALPSHPRFRPISLSAAPALHRSQRFLLKFLALRSCLEHSAADFVLYLDADAVFARRVSARDVSTALEGRELGMVEQNPPPGSPHGRAFFHDHYRHHTRPWLGARDEAPPLDVFRFFNSGVVLARRAALSQICDWTLAEIDRRGPVHQVGEHMIADQDYLQFWANEIRPDCAASLDWSWNHCEHWHGGFPRRGVRVAHLSNACHGPTRRNIWRLRALSVAPGIERSWRRLRAARTRLRGDAAGAASG